MWDAMRDQFECQYFEKFIALFTDDLFFHFAPWSTGKVGFSSSKVSLFQITPLPTLQGMKIRNTTVVSAATSELLLLAGVSILYFAVIIFLLPFALQQTERNLWSKV